MKDIKGVNRGKCLKCDECDEFIGKARCDYCDCVATKHERNDEPDHKKIRLTNVQEDETYLGGSDDIKTNEDSLPVVAITSLSPSGDTSSFTCQDEPMDEPNTNSDVSETEMPISKLDENSLATSLNYEDDHEIKVLQELGKKLEKEELEKYGTECLFQISRNDENLIFSCSVCEKEFKIGNFQKKVQNIKFHISSRSHIGRIQDKVVKSGGKEVCDAMAIFEKFEEEFGKEVFICKGTSAYCRCCNVQINLVARGDPLYRGRCHVSSNEHKANQERKQTNKMKDISSFFTSKRTAAKDHSSLQKEVLCEGWYKDQYTYFKDTSQQLTVDTKLLLNDLKYGEDFGNPSWYPLPFINVKILEESNTTEFNGTYKHVNCSGKVSIREGHSCYMCKNIPNLPSFKKRILLRVQKTDETGNRNLEKVRYEYLTQPEQLDILRDKNEKLEKAKDTIFFLKRREIRQKLKLRNYKEKLVEFSKRGDMKAITHNFVKAQEKGLFKDKKVLFDTLESVARNFHVAGPTGRRFKTATKNFYEALLILGGPRIANFVAINMEGPNLNSVYKWRKLKSIALKPGIETENFIQYALLVKGIMEVHNISPVPVLKLKMRQP